MTDLPKDLRALVAEARTGHDPDESTKARVRASLAATLAAAASVAPVITTLAGTPSASAAPAAMSSLTAKLASLQVWLWTGASVVVAGSGLWAASVLVGSSGTPNQHMETIPVAQHAQAVPARSSIDMGRTVHSSQASPRLLQVLPARSAQADHASADAAIERQTRVTRDDSAARGIELRSIQDAQRASVPSLDVPRVGSIGHMSSSRGPVHVGPAVTTSAEPSRMGGGAAAVNATATSPAFPKHTGLSTELELVRRATAAVGAGRFQAALSALNEHQVRFPHGALLEERLGLQAVSLCGLGLPSGAAYAGRFEEAYPGSPLLERVRVACGTSR